MIVVDDGLLKRSSVRFAGFDQDSRRREQTNKKFRSSFARRRNAMYKSMVEILRQANRFVAPAAASLVLGMLVVAPASAEESGHWKAKAVLVITSGKVVTLSDKAEHQAGLDEYDGVVFSIGDKPFLDNARYQVVSFYDTTGFVNGGFKTFTAADGVVYMQYKITGGAWPKFSGEWTVTGGTEKYKGISGSGKFESIYVSDTALWDVLEGDYKIP